MQKEIDTTNVRTVLEMVKQSNTRMEVEHADSTMGSIEVAVDLINVPMLLKSMQCHLLKRCEY